jgi:predicted DNA-binding transcriptional regulator AlpA
MPRANTVKAAVKAAQAALPEAQPAPLPAEPVADFWNSDVLILRRQDFNLIFPFQKTKIDQIIADKTFPKPTAFAGGRARCWLKRDVRRWIEGQFASDASDGVTKKARAVPR